jgi:hypothetical protein
MKLSTNNKIYVGILGLAILALGFDRLFLGPEAAVPAHVSAAGSPGTVGTPAAASACPAQESQSSIQTLAKRLETAGQRGGLDPRSMRDAFVPADSWLGRTPVAPQAQAAPTKTFAQLHELTSVVCAEEGGSAVIDGKVMQVGQELSGYRLTWVRPGVAVFQSARETVELQLPTMAKP